GGGTALIPGAGQKAPNPESCESSDFITSKKRSVCESSKIIKIFPPPSGGGNALIPGAGQKAERLRVYLDKSKNNSYYYVCNKNTCF
ncbi:MAG: hypothetical protein IJ857_00855, partial [Lachnospiraceae bacterium]|nr:hypothetical protein [Lachnospiraceae bacterium]